MKINQAAPVVQKKDINIDAEPEKVWKVLTAIDRWPHWNDKIGKTIINEAPEVGVRFTWKTNGSKIRSRIHTYDPNEAIGWEGRAFGAKAVHNWFLEPDGNGTKVSVEESMEGWAVALMKNKMNNILEKDMVYWLEQLKTECEK